MSELKEMADAALSYIRVRTDKGEMVPPFCVAHTKAGQHVHVPIPYSNDVERAHTLYKLRMCFGMWEVREYVMAFEAWVVKKQALPDLDPDELARQDLSKDPTRGEGIMIAGASYTESLTGMASIARYGREIAVGPVEWYDADTNMASGEFLGLLPPLNLGPPPPAVSEAFYEKFPQLRLENFL